MAQPPGKSGDLAAFVQQARAVVERLKLASAHTLRLISGGGFKASELAYAAEAGILVSGAQDAQELSVADHAPAISRTFLYQPLHVQNLGREFHAGKLGQNPCRLVQASHVHAGMWMFARGRS
jgi:hypothetical protein